MDNIKLYLVLIIILIIILTIGLWYYHFSKYFYGTSKLILYYTPWCHHCTELKPKWNNFIEDNNGKFNNINIESIDCDENKEIANRYKIENIPSVILHRGEDNILYKGDKNIEDIKKWVLEEIKN